MVKTSRLANQKGFSLIELMVVVAIIAILASFAIPQYQSFQARSRQKEGVTLLNSFFVAAKASEAESGSIWGDFQAIGYNPTGVLHYRVAQATAAGTSPPAATGIPSTPAAFVTSVGYPGSQYSEALIANSPSFYAIATTAACAPATNTLAGTFQACASGVIRSQTTAAPDIWNLNQLKVLTNSASGL